MSPNRDPGRKLAVKTLLTAFKLFQSSKATTAVSGMGGDGAIFPQRPQELSSTADTATSQRLVSSEVRAFAERYLPSSRVLVLLQNSAFDGPMAVVFSGVSPTCNDKRGEDGNKLCEQVDWNHDARS